MAKTKAQRLAKIHEEALLEFDEVYAAQRDERRQAVEDRRFYSIAGAQWEGKLGEQFKNKPKFEVNKTHLSVIRIINEYRNNRITVDFKPADGVENDKLADTCDGLYRADEIESVANEAYDNAMEEAVGGGFGGIRLRAEYEDEYDEDNDYQRIRIEPIYDADSTLFFDLGAKRQDKADAKRAWLLTPMSVQAYEDEYGESPVSWDGVSSECKFDWVDDESVYICEYYRVEDAYETHHIFETLDGDEERYTDADFEADPGLEELLFAVGTQKTGQRKVKTRKVHKYILSGGRVLEDCGYIAGKDIPLIPVYGKRWIVDGIERFMGHVRLSKDVQRLKNMQLSKLAEISAMSPREKPIFTPEQVAAHRTMWAEDNIKDYPFLLADAVTDANGNPVQTDPIGYTRPAQVPPAMAALLTLTEQDMQDLLGGQQGGDKIVSNISGDAVEMIQNRLDMQAFIYMDNMAKAVQRCGTVWLGMAKELMVEPGRRMKTIGKRGEVSSIILGQASIDEATGETIYENDLANAKFDAISTVGPSSDSKRQSTVKSLLGMMQINLDQETNQVLGSMAMMNMDGEGIDEVRDYFRGRLIKMGVVKPTEEETEELMQEMANLPPDANQEYLKAEAKNALASAENKQADTQLKRAKVKETQANIMETLSGIDRDNYKAVSEVVRSVEPAGTTQPLNTGEYVTES